MSSYFKRIKNSIFVANCFKMKKLFTFLSFIILFTSCDDGELTVQNINLEDAPIVKCADSGVLYKKNASETLILIIPEEQEAYENVVGIKTYEINSDNDVRYRLYNGTISADNICAVLQPGTPQIIDEWIATSGTISITTTAKYSTPDSETSATTIIGYNHNIKFLDIVFTKYDGSNQIFSELVYGNYVTSTTTLAFDFNPENVNHCDSKALVYNVAEISGQESLVIENISNSLINNTLGTKSAPIETSVNSVIYKTYLTALPLNPADYFCVSPTPAFPIATQVWTAESGDVTTDSGIIEVLTEDYGNNQFKHTIYFKNVTFYNATSNSKFFYGDKILYGYLITQ